MNSVVLVGRLTKDIELKTTSNGIGNALFTLAVDNPFSQDGQTDFISCVAWRGQAEFLANYCKKGDKVALKGRIQTRSYQNQQGATQFVTEVIVEQVESCQPKQQDAQPQQKQQVKQQPKQQQQTQQQQFTQDDEEMPF